ncbi:hypothetical protein V8F63_09530 [Brevundimonas sp. LF-1]|uniref:hypothetical protein n=1 Tax=Brevundimonas sp. LF-1 TaxID=3126100 RepID=UPI0030E3A815
MAGPYYAEFGAIHHEDVRGFLFTVTPPEMADEVARSLNVAEQVDGMRANFLAHSRSHKPAPSALQAEQGAK